MNNNLIFVIDDSPTVRKVLEVTFHREGYEVQCASSAERAIAWLSSREAQVPDLFLVDLHLPQMQGYSLIRYLRTFPDFRRTPIVIISHYGDLVDKLKGRLVGARAHLVKPVKTVDLLSVAHMYLGMNM